MEFELDFCCVLISLFSFVLCLWKEDEMGV